MIPPIFFNDGFVTDIQIYGEKLNIFNNLFADQCTPIDNGGRLPPFGWDDLSVRMIKICVSAILSHL